MASAIQELARRLVAVEQAQMARSTPQLAYSSIENGALRAHDDVFGETMQIGLQWDGTYAPTVTNGPTPPTPSAAQVLDATEGLVVGWDGSFAGGLIPTPMDFLRVDVHVGATSDFIPTHDNRRGSFTSPQGGFASLTLPAGTYYVKLVMWTFAGKVSAASTATEGDSWPVGTSSDGFEPDDSPTDLQVIGGWEILLARWTPVVNADPVTYKVYVGATPGFTKDATTLAGTTEGSQFTIKALPGDPPANPDDPDLRKLQYGVDYYVAVVASDDDGDATPSTEVSAQIFKFTGSNIEDGTIVGANIVGGTITGDLLAGSIVLSTEFWTAFTGQRAGFTPAGFFAYKSDNSLMFKLPTDGSNAIYDGELVVRGATILGGMSIQSDENELTADSAMTLMRGIVSPTASPQFSVTYDYVTPSTASLTTLQKQNLDPNWGLGAPFDLNPGQVTNIEWRPALGCWSVYQIRTNGTREWYINPDGTPHDLTGAGVYYADWKDWEIWSATEILGGSIPAHNGHYLMFRFMPSGDDYWVSTPFGSFRYSRQNGALPPALTNDGTDLMVAETITGGKLNIRTFRPLGLTSGSNMPAPLVAHESATGYNSSLGISALQYSATRFDFGTTPGFLTAERGVNNVARVVYFSGTNANSIHPHGTTAGASSWVSANKEAGSFEAPATNRRGAGWDGVNFFSYHNDGRLYKHTSTAWDPAVTSSKIWGEITFRDGDAGGTGVHETTPGTPISLTWPRRSKLHFQSPDVPDNGGLDDPDRIRLYVGRGASLPANTGFYQQYEGTGATDLSTLSTVTANPPTTNTFPSANAAIIRSDDDGLQIKGDSSIRAVSMKVGPAGGATKDVLLPGPKWVGYLSSQPAIPAAATLTTLQGWTALESAGITLSSGIFTVPAGGDGLYLVGGQLWWAANTSATGTRLTQVVKTSSPATTIASVTLDAKAAGAPALAQWSKPFRLVAGDTVIVRFSWPSGASGGTAGAGDNRIPTATSQDISHFFIRWMEP